MAAFFIVVIARSAATRQSIRPRVRLSGLLRLACNDELLDAAQKLQELLARGFFALACGCHIPVTGIGQAFLQIARS